MPDPTRPVDAAEIETAWGQAVHDAIFAPKGCHVTSTSPRVCGTTPLTLPIDIAADDPGGWASLASDLVTVPTGAGGVYNLSAILNTVNGDAGQSTRGYVYLNGAPLSGSSVSNDGASNVPFDLGMVINLSAADVITIRASKTGGANPSVTLVHLWLIRRATQLGA